MRPSIDRLRDTARVRLDTGPYEPVAEGRRRERERPRQALPAARDRARGARAGAPPPAHLRRLADRLDDTPRRCLGYRTPREVFEEHLAGPARQPY